MTFHHPICLVSGYLSAVNKEITDDNNGRNCVKTSKRCKLLKCINCGQIIVRHDYGSAVVANTTPDPQDDGLRPPKFLSFVIFYGTGNTGM